MKSLNKAKADLETGIDLTAQDLAHLGGCEDFQPILDRIKDLWVGDSVRRLTETRVGTLTLEEVDGLQTFKLVLRIKI